VPNGGTPGLAESKNQSHQSYDSDQGSTSSGSSSGYQRPQSSTLKPSMDWNNTDRSQTSVRTSLRGGGNDYGQNRLATGFRGQGKQARHGRLASRDVVEISDDSELEDNSEGGGILLNVDAPSRNDSSGDAETPIEISESEDGEIADDDVKTARQSSRQSGSGKQRPVQKIVKTGPLQTSSQNKVNTNPPLFQIDARRGARILADLNPDDLEKQIKYTLFHLPRDQIDLGRPVICLRCLSEGHAEDHCPSCFCSTCGGQIKHTSRVCPDRARCSRCGERGHKIERCESKLRNPMLSPCEFCGDGDHVESSCTQRFFPARTELPPGEIQLWISCAQCGSKDHLAGDCTIRGSKPATAWSLRAYNPKKIVNLSLQTGAQVREKDARNKGSRPEGLQIKGRADFSNKSYQKGIGSAPNSSRQFEDEDDFTSRLASNRNKRPASPRNHIRFDDNGRSRTLRGSNNDYFYRPRSPRLDRRDEYDSYQPSSDTDYRGRDGYGGGRSYQEDQRDDRDYYTRRGRSKSPPRNDRGIDSWKPPLPIGPPPPQSLPARPAPPRNQQARISPKNGRQIRGKQKGGGGGAAVNPMPSAAKNAWNRGRL
jgi:protein AIR1/2